ncbi:MAG TPA: hypothetical protein VKV96_05380 [Roseiarcus sp.]|nr:hypothetical protein [Roseiarcus sp.]
MAPEEIEIGRTYLCVYGDARYRAAALDKTGAVVLVRLEAKLDKSGPIGRPDAPEIGAEIWVAPESIAPDRPDDRPGT